MDFSELLHVVKLENSVHTSRSFIIDLLHKIDFLQVDDFHPIFQLNEYLQANGYFETEEEMNLRLKVLSKINAYVKKWVRIVSKRRVHLLYFWICRYMIPTYSLDIT